MYLLPVYLGSMDAVIIRIIDLPHGVYGVTVKDEEGDYNVYLNARLSFEARVVAFRHELEHIKNGDFYNDLTVREKEENDPF